MNGEKEGSTEYTGKLRILVARADGPDPATSGCTDHETVSVAPAGSKSASSPLSPKRAESMLSQRLIAKALGIYLGRAPAPEELAGELRQAGGKPCFPAYPDFHFNVSHSGGIAVCGISDHPIGVDLQKIPEDPKTAMRIARRFFSKEEQDALKTLGDRGDTQALCRLFCRYWTARESYIKLTGKGLAEPFSGYRPDLEAGLIRVPGSGSGTDSSRTIYLTECSAPAGFCLTVCSFTPLPFCEPEHIHYN